MRKKKERIVRLELDPQKPRPLTAKHRAELAALAAMPDERIDYSDIPATSAVFWEKAVRPGLYRPRKRQLSIRVDADVVEWLKSQGQGYHTRLNTILRGAMLDDLKHHAPTRR